MSYIYQLYLFFIILYFINTKYISIPFQVENFTYEGGKKLINKYVYKDIHTNILVGSPPQNVSLSINLGEYSTFIISKDAYDYYDSTFDKDKSDTYQELSKPENYYYQIYSEAAKSKDDFVIDKKNTTINSLTFNLVTLLQVVQDFCNYCEVLTQPGMIGLLIAQMKNFEENISDTNFISQLKNRSLISSYDFFFDLDNNNLGNLIIGAKPDEYYKNEKYEKLNYVTIKTLTPNNDLEWSIEFNNVFYGDKKMQVKPAKAMLLRIEFGLITGYPEWEYALEDEFFSQLIKEEKCFKLNETALDPARRYSYYYCKKETDLSGFKPFTFSININEINHNFTLTKDDLFLDIGDKYFFLMAFGGMTEYVLGFPFIKKNQLIFNQDTKTIGFYIDKKAQNNENENSLEKYIVIISVLSVIFICLIIFLIWFILKKRKNKIKATELLDNQYNENKGFGDEQKNRLIDERETTNSIPPNN